MNSPDTQFLIKTKIKHWAARLLSIFLLISGLYKLGLSLYETFTLSQNVQAGITIPHEQFQHLLKKFLVETSEAIVETIYGMILLFSHSHKVKLLHIALGIAIALLPFLINDQFLRQVENELPQVQFTAPRVYAQETSPQQALSDYQFQLQKYREAHQEYLSAKNLYLSFQTLNAKAAAIEKTKALIIRRAETLRSYLAALRITLATTSGVSSTKKSALTTKLLIEEKLLADYQTEVPPITDSLILSQSSLKVEATYPQLQVLGYETLHTILLGQQHYITDQLQSHHQKLQQLLTTTTDTDINKTQALQWLTDIQTALNENQTSFIETQQQVNQLQARNSAFITNQRDFTKTLNLFDLTQSRLLNVINFFKETIKLIKYG